MGEKIRDLGTIVIGDKKLVVELNKATGDHKQYDIHIQNSRVRLNVSCEDFFKMTTGIIAADYIIKQYKNEEN